jgi:hypothetical protein
MQTTCGRSAPRLRSGRVREALKRAGNGAGSAPKLCRDARAGSQP